MNKGSVEDRLEIRELMEQFAHGAMLLDGDYWGETWAEEGSWKLPSMETAAVGKDVVKAAFKEKMAYVDYISMISVPADIEVDGDRATARCFCRELIYPKAGGKVTVVGYFNDVLVKRDGRWLFTSRVYNVIGKEM